MICPICAKQTVLFGKVDANRDCLRLLFTSGEKYIDYYICTACNFTYAPTVYKWTDKEFRERIYNDEYVKIDPDFAYERPSRIADSLISVFPDYESIKHLDYGGGTGFLSAILKSHKWNTTYYDPYFIGASSIPEYKCNLITAIEIFEHTNNPRKLMKDITSLLSNKGLLLITTALSDTRLSTEWDYIAPRNGHISIYSQQSLKILAKQYNLNFRSFSKEMHVMWKKVPNWALHLNLAA